MVELEDTIGLDPIRWGFESLYLYNYQQPIGLLFAGVTKLVDVADLKSAVLGGVRVRVPSLVQKT